MQPLESHHRSAANVWRGVVIGVTAALVLLFSFLCWNHYTVLREERTALFLANGQRALLAFKDHVMRLLDYDDSYARAVRDYYLHHGDAGLPEYLDNIRIEHANSFQGTLSIGDAEGRILFNVDKLIQSNVTSSGIPYFEYFRQNPRDSVYIDPTRLGRLTGQLQFRLVRPILREGRFDGYVMLSLRPEHFTLLFEAFDLGPHSFTAMLSLDHRLIARQPAAPAETYGKPVDSLDLWPNLAKADSGQYVTQSPVDGIRRHILYTKIPGYPVVIDIGISPDDILESLAETRVYIVGQAVAFAVVAVLFCLLILAILRKNDDLSRAERTIRGMANTLEQRVEERTAELAKSNEDLRLAMDHLVASETLASLGGLVAGVTHELNTALGNMLSVASALEGRAVGFAERVRAGPLQRSTLDEFIAGSLAAAQIMRRGAEHAAELVANFKQTAVDQSSLRRRRFALGTVVGEVVSSLHNKLKNTAVSVELDIPEDLVLDNYPGPFAQIVTNFVMNSLLHAFDEGQAGRIRISARCDDGQLLMTYEDDGRGMSEEVAERAFEPFFTTKLNQGGSGLGLYIIRSLVTEVLNGTLRLSTRPGTGLRFDLTCPLDAPKSVPMRAAVASEQPP